MEFTPFFIAPLPKDGPRVWVQIEDFAVPEHFTAKSDAVTLEIKVSRRGEPRCIEISVHDDDGVTGETLRGIPVARLVKEAFAVAASRWGPDEEGGEPIPHVIGTTLEDRLAFYDRFAKGARQPRSGSPLTDKHLQQVATIYREAGKRDDPPTQTVAEVMNVARPTAGRWIGEARKRKFLGPAKRGRAGEAS